MKKSNDWVKNREELIKLIDKMDPHDRLNYVSVICSCNLALASSVNGWVVWLSDPRVFDRIAEKDLKEYAAEFRELAKRFVRLDIKASKKYGGANKPSKEANALVI